MKAKIIVQSNKIDTYTNVMAAICDTYPVNHIMLSFIIGEIDENFIDSIKSNLASLSNNNIYSKASRVRLEAEIANKDHNLLVKGWDILDVTGVSKEIAIHISAASISNKNVCICQLSWKKSFQNGERWILTDNNHSYSNLMSTGSLSVLYKEYFRKKNILTMFGVIFSIIFICAITKIIWPGFIIPEDLVNILSLLIGAAGLYLAILSLKKEDQ